MFKIFLGGLLGHTEEVYLTFVEYLLHAMHCDGRQGAPTDHGRHGS